jgi:transcriptional regulator with XRE-family HTH domain
MDRIGTKIRNERKKSGMTLESLAKQVGISLITLQRIETGRSSPSVALLSEIAQCLNKPIFSFITERGSSYAVLKRAKLWASSSSGLNVRLIGPRNMVGPNISVTHGKLKKGKNIPLHANSGVEYAYVLKGKCEIKVGQESIVLDKGDSISYNARIEHEVTALEDHEFIAVYVKDMLPQ